MSEMRFKERLCRLLQIAGQRAMLQVRHGSRFARMLQGNLRGALPWSIAQGLLSGSISVFLVTELKANREERI